MSNAELSKSVLRRSDLMLSAPYVEPAGEFERAVADLWQLVLNIDLVGLQDDFFEIGGDSLAATTLAGQLENRFGCKFGPSTIVEHSTVAAQAAFLGHQKNNHSSRANAAPPYLTLFNANGAKPPLFIIHGGMGFTMYDKNFLDGLGSDQPVGFLEAPGLDGNQEPLASIEEFAETYLNAIRQAAPGAKWQIAANCSGSFIALELSLLAEQRGEQVSTLLLIDPPRLGWSMHRFSLRILKKVFLDFSRSLLPGKAANIPGAGGHRRHDREDEAAAYAASIETHAWRQNKVEERIRRRFEGDGTSALPSRVAYNAEAMRRVRHDLHKAFRAYKPREWNGTVRILACADRHIGINLYKRYFPNVRRRLARHNHDVLFSEGLTDILQFLRDGTAPDSEKLFQP